MCAVCGEPAGKHSYYGGQVCTSCRAFFRRSVQSGCHLTFCCINKYVNCKIKLSTRKNCQACRYDKCLRAGMRPNWILSEEERARRFHGRKRKLADQLGLVDPLAIDSPEENSNLTRTCILPLRTNKKTEVPKTECPFDKPLTLEETNIVKQMGEDFFRLCTGRTNDLRAHLLTELVQTATQSGKLSRVTMQGVADAFNNRTKMCFSLFQVCF
jgi:hypothetical protein